MILTTISPANVQRQKIAIDSWLKLGYTVKSINSKSDIIKAKEFFDIEFVETDKLGTEFGKDYVRLNGITDLIDTDCFVINSDIELTHKLPLAVKGNSFTIYSRSDYADIHQRATKFPSGFDAFYITKEFAKQIPESKLVIGQCHWDYFLPIIAIRNNYHLFTPYKSGMYHKTHAIQYSLDKWRLTGKYFAQELGLSGNVLNDSNESYRLIKSKLNYF